MTLTQIVKAGQVWGIKRKHIKTLDISLSNLENWMFKVADQMKNVETIYGKWMVENVNKETLFKLGRTIPVKYLPAYINVEKKKATLVSETMPTLWKLYNDITFSVWHEPVEMKTKEIIFERLHSAFGLGK
jgi:hypothetical protein